MKALIKKSTALGCIKAPSSKSHLHRLLICAALAEDESVIKCDTVSDDISATVDCLTALGANISRSDGAFKVTGIDVKGSAPSGTPNARESGSTLRFLIPIAALSGSKVLFSGSKRLMERPLSVYENIFREKGMLLMRYNERFLCVDGPLKSGEFYIDGSVSSQFISGLLFALPLTDGDSKIYIKPPFESRPYVDLTIATMASFGVNAYFLDEYTLNIPGNQSYRSGDFSAEGDWSSAAFLHALSYLGGTVTIDGLNADSLQGDKACLENFEALKNGKPTIDISDCPDLAPILFTLAAYFNGADFIGTGRLSLKESPRDEVMATELSKLGADVIVNENSVTVNKSKLHAPLSPLFAHNDHRVAMALSVILTALGGELEGAEAISKSYPGFFDDMINLGVEIKLAD